MYLAVIYIVQMIISCYVAINITVRGFRVKCHWRKRY